MQTISDFVTSLFKFREIPYFLENRKRRVFGYGVLMATLVFLCQLPMSLLVLDAVDSHGQLSRVLSAYVDEFDFKGGRLDVPEKISGDIDGVYVYINTAPGFSFDEGLAEQQVQKKAEAYFLDSEKMLMKKNSLVQVYYFEDMSDLIMKDSAMTTLAFMEASSIFMSVGFVAILYIIAVPAFFLGTFFYSVTGKIISLVMKLELTFGEIFVMAVYSQTLPMVIRAICNLLNIAMLFELLLRILTVFIIWRVLKSVKKIIAAGDVEESEPRDYSW